MNEARVERVAGLVCNALCARLVAVTPLPAPNRDRLLRIEVAFPVTAPPLDFIQIFESERVIATLSNILLANRLYCALWEAIHYAGLAATARAPSTGC